MSNEPTPESLQNTQKLMTRANQVLAYGCLRSVIEGALDYPGGAFPQFADRAEGCRIYDTTGQAFVDWFIGWGPVILGYHHPEVDAAIADQLRIGPHLSLMHPLEVEVAEMLVEMIPCAEKVAFGKNGSDVTCAAVRLARAYTGREGVLSCGYHGFHDWFQVLNEQCQGLPSSLKNVIASFPYNDLDALEDLLNLHEGKIAAVIIDPIQDALPAPGFLEGLRELTRSHKALLIFDEVVTGFRVAPGGVQEAYGVTPDLTCLGKALTNGMPLSALVGKAEFMEPMPRIFFGLTFRGETLSLAAAKACLNIYKREPVAKRLAEKGETVRERFNLSCAKHGLPWTLGGHPSRMKLLCSDTGRITAEGARLLFVQECLKHGMFSRGILLTSHALDPEALETTAIAMDHAMETVARAFEKDTLDGFLHFPVPPQAYCKT
ncbi:MAG: aminotransferase class III-fold pyridoxal phosphate-dependent enzyme [Planctomycetota bacterium]